MKNARERRSGVGTGTISLLVIFTVLCLATLALLSVSTAVSSQRISQRSVQNTVRMAAVQGQAAVQLAELDATLLGLAQFDSEEDYFELALTTARNLGYGCGPEQHVVWFTLPVSETTTLVTRVQLLPQGGDKRYHMVEQSAQITGEWVPETGVSLWPG